jgi:FkbM family methyltransferase
LSSAWYGDQPAALMGERNPTQDELVWACFGQRGDGVFVADDFDLRDTHTERVEIVTLDSLLAQAGYGRVDFISLGTEGTELDVLRGSSGANLPCRRSRRWRHTRHRG